MRWVIPAFAAGGQDAVGMGRGNAMRPILAREASSVQRLIRRCGASTALIAFSTLISLNGASALPALADGSVHTAGIEYQPGTLEVFVDDPDTPVLTVNLEITDVLGLGSGSAWVGFTSGDGDGVANYDVLNWTFAAGSTVTSFLDFSSVSNMTLVGSAAQAGSRLRLIPTQGTFHTGAAWLDAKQDLAGGFTTTFDFQISSTNGIADGLTFVIQNASTKALGGCGFGLGYLDGDNYAGRCDPFGNPGTIPKALAVEFDTFENTERFGNPPWQPEYVADRTFLGGVGTAGNHVAVVSARIPEPTTALLLACGLVGLGAIHRPRPV
jgi:hypothetical protein